MTKLFYATLIGIRLALPAVDEEGAVRLTTTQPAATELASVVDDLSQGTLPSDAAPLPGQVAVLPGTGAAQLYLKALVEQNRDRLACILDASLDGDGRILHGVEAGGYIGGTASTIMVHDGMGHTLPTMRGPFRGPHIHVWPPPQDALAWVHTHDPKSGVQPSRNDIDAAAQMRAAHGVNLPFIVVTKISVTAYWHGQTWQWISLAGKDWADGTDRASCARVYRQS